jgi:LuxR family transcriptional regulator
MKQAGKINLELQRLVATADWRFAIGLRIRFNHPTLLYQTYPEAWLTYYAQNGLVFADPTVRWGMTHTGICDWADLEADDAAGVLRQARNYGLVHGIAVSVGDQATRSMGFFAHATRPISDAERKLALEVIEALHAETEGVTDLSPEALAPYQALNDALRSVNP